MSLEPPPGPGEHRFEGYPLAVKHGWMRQGRGPGAVTPAVELLTELAGGLAESRAAVHAALDRLAEDWGGEAAEAGRGELTGLARQADRGAAAAARGVRALEDFAGSHARLVARVDPPPPEHGPATSDLAAVTGLGQDHRARIAERHRRDRAADDALYQHQATTRAALTAFPDPDADEPPGHRDRW